MQNKSLIETKNNNKIIAGCLILLGIIGLAGCGSGSAYYEEYIEIPNQQWNQSNVPFFEFEITDTLQRYDMYFNIRHNKAYEWKNIWVFLTFEVPGGQVDRDTLEFVLQDGQSRWLGTSSGDIGTEVFCLNLSPDFHIKASTKHLLNKPCEPR